MIPLGDHIRRRTFWISTLTLILANVMAFLFELSLGPNLDRLIFVFGIIPARYTIPHGVAALNPGAFVVPVFASMFLHAGWIHLLGNMLFLFVFGRSIEDRYGHVKFLMMYFLSGLGAAIVHIIFNAGSHIPTVGASGAIAGVLGAYLISFPNARITTLIPVLFFLWKVELPAVLILGYWFLIQFVTGFGMLSIQSATRGGGVAWWAHVGGFLLGVVLALALRPQRGRVGEVGV